MNLSIKESIALMLFDADYKNLDSMEIAELILHHFDVRFKDDDTSRSRMDREDR